MTNQSNVTVIADRLISYLRQTTNEYVRVDIVAKITQLAERFAPDNQWFIQTMNAVFELGEWACSVCVCVCGKWVYMYLCVCVYMVRIIVLFGEGSVVC